MDVKNKMNKWVKINQEEKVEYVQWTEWMNQSRGEWRKAYTQWINGRRKESNERTYECTIIIKWINNDDDDDDDDDDDEEEEEEVDNNNTI